MNPAKDQPDQPEGLRRSARLNPHLAVLPPLPDMENAPPPQTPERPTFEARGIEVPPTLPGSSTVTFSALKSMVSEMLRTSASVHSRSRSSIAVSRSSRVTIQKRKVENERKKKVMELEQKADNIRFNMEKIVIKDKQLRARYADIDNRLKLQNVPDEEKGQLDQEREQLYHQLVELHEQHQELQLELKYELKYIDKCKEVLQEEEEIALDEINAIIEEDEDQQLTDDELAATKSKRVLDWTSKVKNDRPASPTDIYDMIQDPLTQEERIKTAANEAKRCKERFLAQQEFELAKFNKKKYDDELAAVTAKLENLKTDKDPQAPHVPKIETGVPDGAAAVPTQNIFPHFMARQSMKQQLPFFDGNVQEWPIFLSEFKMTTEACKLTDVENLQRLQKCLKGEARERVQALLVSPENVTKIVEKLEKRFGKPKAIVTNMVTQMKSMQPVQEGNHGQFLKFIDAVDNLATTATSLKCQPYICNSDLLDVLVKKMPNTAQLKWGSFVREKRMQFPTITEYSEWLEEQSECLETIYTPVLTGKSKTDKEKKPDAKDNNAKGRRDHAFAVAPTEENEDAKKPPYKKGEKYCHQCNITGHRIDTCTKFAALDYKARIELFNKKALCRGCGRYGHMLKDCRLKKPCGINNCAKQHHALLHKDEESAKDKKAEETAIENAVLEATLAESANHANPETGEIQYHIAPVTLCGKNGKFLKTFVFLDSGAGITVLEKSVADFLGLKGEKAPLIFNGLTDSSTVADSSKVNLDIITRNKEKFHLSNVRTVDALRLPQRSVTRKALNKWNHLRGLDIPTFENAKPTILIGQDHGSLLAPYNRIDGPPNAPVASLTKFGWVLYGRLASTLEVPRNESILYAREDDWSHLHNMIKSHFSVEDFGVKLNAEKPKGNDDKRAEAIIDQTLKKVDGRYEAGLLWKQDDISLPESRSNALKRLYTMERKMDRDPIFAAKYCEKFLTYEQNGFIKKLSIEESQQGGPRLWYLPHFGVTKPSKPGKIRLVFDAAAKSNGCSLNDHLLKGPDNLTPLMSVLFKFRERAVGICGDIKDMYHQVLMRPEDQGSQRFLWRGMERNKTPDEYVLPVMFFGAACSPSLAQEAKNRNAMEFAEKFQDAAHAIVEKNYVDDFLASKDTPEETFKLFKEVFYINKQGGFHTCNWVSSSPDVMSRIPEGLRAACVKTVDLDTDDSLIERVLGLHWKPFEDLFTFNTQFHRVKKEILTGAELPTKREALSLLMSIFDPLGFVSSFTVKAKIMLQETWRHGIGWDDEIPSSMQDGWNIWIKELPKIAEFRIPRCYSALYSKSTDIQLHIFCDASESAFAAVAYFRIASDEGDIEVSLVSSKTRVAPLKPLSIPRMELQAAVMGCRLAQTIKDKHEIKPHRTVYWTDSRTVMCWIRSDGRRFQQFVSHRIGEIQETSDVSEWKWIPTVLNVADEATRNVADTDLTPESTWLNGPAFLRFDEDHWPKEKKLEVDVDVNNQDLELKKEIVCKAEPRDSIIQIQTFSSWKKLLRITAWVFKIISFHFDRKIVPELNPVDLDKAETYWLKISQAESFEEDIRDIKSEKGIKKQSRLFQISPFIDEDGLLKVKGRLQGAAFLPKAAKFPIILDPKHPATKLIIRYYHEAANHHGQERVANEIRQRFHILNLRTAVRSSWFCCQECRNHRAEPPIPKMGQLPLSRLQHHVPPFTITGMDYFGPMEVTVGRHHEKRYGALFTCMSTRAVHIEIAHSLNTDSCIMAIRRFAARRGNPAEIHSDNGTNFKGANNELLAALRELDVQKIQNKLANRGIKWIFIPPASPHMGGSWERLVKSVKVALHSTLKERYPKDEILLTLMTEAEHVVNSRPLTHVPMDPEDEEALTPNHFLIGASSNLQPPGSFDDTDLCLRKQWRIAQRLADHFWQRWIREYLPSLLTRSKWHDQRDPVKIGDVGVIVDERMPRNTWPKGIIVKTYPGKDGIVRVVDFETKMGTYRRPVAKIAILDVRRPTDAVIAKDCSGNKTVAAYETPFRKTITKMKKAGAWQRIMQDYKRWLSTKNTAA